MKKKIIVILTLIVVIGLSGYVIYQATQEQDEKLDKERRADEKTQQERKDEEPKTIETETIKAYSVDDFSFNIFQKLTQEEDNLFISPYSIYTALTLAYTGADGETKKEMQEVLGLQDKDIQEIKEEVLEIKQRLEDNPENTEISIANALFLRDDIPFKESYTQNAKEYFEAEVDELPETGEPINDWIAEKTNDLIQNMIDPGPIPGDVIAYLFNTIYFNAPWQDAFDEEKTQERTFYAQDSEEKVEMMEREGNYTHLIEDDLEMVTIDYEDDSDLVFHAIKPQNLEDFYDDLDYEKFTNLKDETKTEEIILRLPKFKMESDIGVNDTLEAMGIKQAWDREQADFSNMVNLDELQENIFINRVQHKTYIEIDEEETEAAAATGIDMRVTSALPETPPIIEFNKPFLFLIENTDTETILFMGQFKEPA